MRDMTPAELDMWYDEHQWPCGHGSEYLPGPRGGILRNVECPKCGMRISVIDPQSGFNWRVGQVLETPRDYTPPERSLWKRVFAIFRRD